MPYRQATGMQTRFMHGTHMHIHTQRPFMLAITSPPFRTANLKGAHQVLGPHASGAEEMRPASSQCSRSSQCWVQGVENKLKRNEPHSVKSFEEFR